MFVTRLIKLLSLSLMIMISAGVCLLAWAVDRTPAPAVRIPILAELFTSEGCSSCPPADRFLQKLDQQPISGADIIVLSEHVDYWNHIGWRDPYSSHFYSERQSAYANRFGLDSVYTPQMIVDGTTEFTGSDTAQAEKAFALAITTAKVPVHLLLLASGLPHTLQAHIAAGPLNASFRGREAEIYVALALNHAESHVSAGENGGRTLTHVAVVRSLSKAGTLTPGNDFHQNVQLKLAPGDDPHNLRVIAFVQEAGQGRVLGAAEESVSQ